MNNERRKRLREAVELIEQAKAIVEECQSDEQDYYDNMPESFQQGEKGEKASGNADTLQEAVDKLEEVVQDIDNAQE